MDFGVLGPLVVREDGREITPPRGKQRSLLAILLLHANATVSSDRLIDALWGDEPPATARHAVEVHVSALRGRLDRTGAPRILTRPNGYALRVEEGELDVQRFERLYEEALRAVAAGDASGALEWFRRAESLWRGPALGDLADEPFALKEVARLEGLRSAVRAERLDAQLAAGRHAETVPELESLARADPLDERLHGQLMLALYRDGRQVEALRVYRDLRATLDSELGLEPGPEIERLQLAILRHDAALEAPSRRPAREPSSDEPRGAVHRMASGRRPSARMSTRGRAVVVVVAGVVLAATTSTTLRSSSTLTPPAEPLSSPTSSRSPAAILVAADSVGRMDGAGRIVATVRLGAQPDAIALGAGSAWVTDPADDTVTRLDAAASTVIQRIPVGGSPAGIAFGFGAVWVANSGDRTVSRIAPSTDEVVATIPVGTAPAGVATDDRWVWVTNRLDHTLSRIDPADGSTKTFAVGSTPLGVATAAGSVWVADFDSSDVVRVDAGTGARQAQVGVGHGPSAIAAAPSGDAVWVVNSRDGTVSRIDTKTASVTAAITVGADPAEIAVGPDGVWVAVPSMSELVKLDPASGQVVGRFPIGAGPRSVVVDAGGPLFTARQSEGSHRGGTLVVVSPAKAFPTTTDPSYQTGALPLMTHDALVAYKRVGGPDGQTLVPDLATSTPTSPDGGRTWTFQLRAGVRFSTGAPVRPSDVLESFERAVIAGNDPGTLGSGLFGNTEIIGASACGAKPPCDLSRGITADDASGTVTFHLVAADPDFPSLTTAAYIVPAGTPPTESASPVPGTGPYIVVRYEEGRSLHLVRNPYFHEWSKDAQPDGYPDAIDWTASSLADPSSLVEEGSADIVLFSSALSAERLAQLRTRVPAQLHVGPSQQTWFEMMNTRIPPFDDVRVRQAINYAADRQAIVDVWGGPLAARITCQIVPPEYSGYEPYCPYTVGPNANGRWLAPDLEKAKALIDQAGVKGQRVTVWGWDDGGQHAAVARYFTTLLDRLGFRATTRLLELEPYFTFLTEHPEQVQMAGFWVQSSTRSGSDMIRGIFTCPDFPIPWGYVGQPSGFCSRRIDADVTRAQALEATDPMAANHLWARVDAAYVDAAPAVMAFNPTDVTFVSERVGGYEHHPVYQIMLDQLWVR